MEFLFYKFPGKKMQFYQRNFANFVEINGKTYGGSLVGTQEQRSKFNNFGSRKAFLIIFFLACREFFVAPGVKFLKFLF